MPAMPFSPCDPSQPVCHDATVTILTHIFGPIIDTLVRGVDPNTVSASSNILAAMFGYFNSGVLAVASIIVSYVAAMGTVNTANDGEAMGKAWSSVWTPIRIVGGGAVLLPSASGYSFIQMFVLTLALWSVGFANGIYKLGMEMGILKPDGVMASSYQPGTYFGMRDFAKQYLASAYCARSANAVFANAEQADQTPRVMPDSSHPDRKTVTGTRTDYTYYVKDRNPNTNLAGGEPVCGTITLTSYGVAGSYADDTGTQAALDSLRASLSGAKLAATMSMMQDIDGWVATMPTDMGKPGWDAIQSAKLNEIVKKYEEQVATKVAASMQGSGGASSALKQGSSAFMDSMLREGWAMSAGWYQRVGVLRSKLSTVTGETVGSVSQPSMSGLPSDARSVTLTSSVSTVVETIVKKSEQAGNGYEGSATPRPEDLSSLLPTSAESDINVGSLANDLTMKFTLIVNNAMNGATNVVIGSGTGVDAISRMKLTGDLLASYRAILLTAKFGINTAMTAARVVVSGVGGVQILGTKVDGSGAMGDIWDWLQVEISPMLADLATYLGILGFYFSVFLPSLPYMLFMLTVVGWVLGVLQTVIAAPLWATMHMRPSQTFIGSDAQGYLLLLALFVRPALAVIGLFAAMLIADPIVDYITKAFFAIRGDVVSSTGFIGAVSQFFTFFWWFTAYGMLLLPVLYMIYGLPQVLPDHVLKWINAGVHDLGATGASAAMQSRAPAAAHSAGASTAMALGGNRGGGDKGGPSGLKPGGGLLRADSNGAAGGRSEPINAGAQGIIPASATGDAGVPGGGSSGSASATTGRAGGQSSAMAGGQGSVGESGGTGQRRSLGNKLSDGLGVAMGRAITDSTMAVKDAAAGGARGFAGRVASNMKDAMVSAGGEGVAAYQKGADSRIGAFKSQMALRGALNEGPQGEGSTTDKAASLISGGSNGMVGGGSSSPLSDNSATSGGNANSAAGMGVNPAASGRAEYGGVGSNAGHAPMAGQSTSVDASDAGEGSSVSPSSPGASGNADSAMVGGQASTFSGSSVSGSDSMVGGSSGHSDSPLDQGLGGNAHVAESAEVTSASNPDLDLQEILASAQSTGSTVEPSDEEGLPPRLDV